MAPLVSLHTVCGWVLKLQQQSWVVATETLQPPVSKIFTIWPFLKKKKGFASGTSGKEHTFQCRGHKRPRFDLWARKVPWRRARQLTPVFLLGELHGQRSQQATVYGVTKSRTRLKRLSMPLKKSCLSRFKITEGKTKEQTVFWAVLPGIRRKEAVFPIEDSFTKEENPEAKLLLDAEAWKKLLCHGILIPLAVQPLKSMICAFSAAAFKFLGTPITSR